MTAEPQSSSLPAGAAPTAAPAAAPTADSSGPRSFGTREGAEAQLREIESWFADFLWPEPDGKQRAKRERILISATDLFSRFGYRKTSIDEVAQAAGIAKGTVYLYYRNKAELVLHAIAREKEGVMARLFSLLELDVPPAERLKHLIVLGLLGVREMPLLARLTEDGQELALALAEADVSVLERINGWRLVFMIDLLDEVTGQRLSREQLAARAQALIDLIGGVATSGQLARDDASLGSYVETLAQTLVHGVASTAAVASTAGRESDVSEATADHRPVQEITS
ncbi:MAG: TetR/AcrR family transcriptional regulator [Pseudomonadota bacterium]